MCSARETEARFFKLRTAAILTAFAVSLALLVRIGAVALGA